MHKSVKDLDKMRTIAQTAQKIMQYHLACCRDNMVKGFGNKSFDNICQRRLKDENCVKTKLEYTFILEDIEDASKHMSEKFGINSETIAKLMKNFINQQANNEVEAYTTTEAVLDKWGKFDPKIMANTLMQKDFHRFIADMTE